MWFLLRLCNDIDLTCILNCLEYLNFLIFNSKDLQSFIHTLTGLRFPNVVGHNDDLILDSSIFLVWL